MMKHFLFLKLSIHVLELQDVFTLAETHSTYSKIGLWIFSPTDFITFNFEHVINELVTREIEIFKMRL